MLTKVSVLKYKDNFEMKSYTAYGQICILIQIK